MCCVSLHFQPKFGASLQILKVEIGGDAQSTGDAKYYGYIIMSKYDVSVPWTSL